jgi:hypothetical protein
MTVELSTGADVDRESLNIFTSISRMARIRSQTNRIFLRLLTLFTPIIAYYLAVAACPIFASPSGIIRSECFRYVPLPPRSPLSHEKCLLLSANGCKWRKRTQKVENHRHTVTRVPNPLTVKPLSGDDDFAPGHFPCQRPAQYPQFWARRCLP